jgi:biopolymer transport protein ExbD
MKASVLQNQKMHSPLESMKRIQATGGSGKDKGLFFSLNLTTLIDAFCILVIFLLSNMNGQIQNLQMKDMVLPAAVKTEALDQGLIVRIEKNDVFLEDQKIKTEDIAKALLDAKKPDNTSLIIQADRRSDYEKIGMILRAGGQAGYEKYVFAVLPGT